MTGRLDGLTHRDAPWAGLRVVVTGLGISGYAAAEALVRRGAAVRVLDAGTGAAQQQERAAALRELGADVRLGPEHVAGWPAGPAGPDPAGPDLAGPDLAGPDLAGTDLAGTDLAGTDLLVTSPGWRPDHPVLTAAQHHGIPLWGEVELAWRMRPAHDAAPWLTVTGTNGKTTTVQMLAAMLTAAGRRAVAAGNVGTPLLEVVLDPQPYDVVAVELSSFQLHYSHSIAPLASCCLNLAADHLDWHGSMLLYAAAKARVYARTKVACVYNVEDPATEQMVTQADVQEGCRAIGFTLGVPGPSMVGLVDDVLADRAFVAQRATSAAELATLADLVPDGAPRGAPGGAPDTAPEVLPHLLADALAAAALARAYGVSPAAVRDGLRAFTPDEHRSTGVGELDGVRFVNDSKATNPHAARAALAAYPSVVWIAGGQLKGADVEELVREAAPRLRAAVLLGQDRALIADALARHAPDVPVHEVDSDETGDVHAVMDEVIERALGASRPGDVVLLAPAAASLDMFVDYAARGTAFTQAARRRTSRTHRGGDAGAPGDAG